MLGLRKETMWDFESVNLSITFLKYGLRKLLKMKYKWTKACDTLEVDEKYRQLFYLHKLSNFVSLLGFVYVDRESKNYFDMFFGISPILLSLKSSFPSKCYAKLC